MFLKVEPAGFFMYTVQLMFDCAFPTSEDAQVKSYLVEKQLEPRVEWEETIEGRNYQLMQFGGCYLGNHLQEIGNLQRSAVETELIAEVVAQFLDEGSCDSTEFDLDARSGIEKHLIGKFNLKTTLASMNQVNLLLIFLLRSYSSLLGKYEVAISLVFIGAGDGNRTHVASLEG
ncbi:MAG: hypothetical protein CM1200mP15_01130 [Dehalococcoidia bacterium]|nr:MAG: hypothetical protein CM1200mP15_01130 [Dehalococcoidia bacterium]